MRSFILVLLAALSLVGQSAQRTFSPTLRANSPAPLTTAQVDGNFTGISAVANGAAKTYFAANQSQMLGLVPAPQLGDQCWRTDVGTMYVFLGGDGTQISNWTTFAPPYPVTSVFGRVGAVVANTGDYTVSQVTGALAAADLANTGNVSLGDALVGVKSTLSNSVATTQHEVNSRRVYVEDFGAVGDGTTDDTTAIQNAINANTGGVIVFGNKSYKVTRLTMSGANTQLQFSGGTNIVNANVIGTLIPFNASFATNVMTLVSAPTIAPVVGNLVTASGVATGTTITSILSGTGGIGSTYQLSTTPGTLASRSTYISPGAFNTNYCTFVITADGCSIDGGTTGKITSPGTWDAGNSYPGYAVIYANANRTTIKNLKFVNVRRVGIWFADGDDQMAYNLQVDGNYPTTFNASTGGGYTGVETVNYGVFFDPGAGASRGNMKMTNCLIKTCVQGFFGGNYGSGDDTLTGGVNINGNNFENCWNHGIYCETGFGNVIANNSFLRCQIPIVCFGHYNVVNGNTLYTTTTGNSWDTTGIQMREPVGCVVTNNTVVGDAPASSAIIYLANLSGDVLNTVCSDNVVANNVIITSGGSSSAIQVGSNTQTTTLKNNTVMNNRIISAGKPNRGVIDIQSTSGSQGQNNRVIGNDITMSGETNGISVIYSDGGEISRNTLRLNWSSGSAKTLAGVYLYTVNYCKVKDNIFIADGSTGTDNGANITFRSIWEDTPANYNIIDSNIVRAYATGSGFSSVPLFLNGSATIARNFLVANTSTPARNYGTVAVNSGSASATVTNQNVLSTSLIQLTPSDSGGGKLMAAPGVYVTVSAGSFTVSTADGTNAAQTSTFTYVIQ